MFPKPPKRRRNTRYKRHRLVSPEERSGVILSICIALAEQNQAEYLEKRAGEYESSLRELLQGNEALQKEFMGMSE